MNREKKRGVEALLLILGLISLAYYALCIHYAWIGVSWLWLWPVFAAFCFACCLLLHAERKGRIAFPRWLRTGCRIAVIAGCSVFCVIEGFIIAAMYTQPVRDLDYIIVLGAAVRGEEPTSPMILRMERALAYLDENPHTAAVASGGRGNGETISEAECIARYLTAHGIAPERIIKEERSANTRQNLQNSFALIPKDASIGVVTSSFHLFRAMLAARQAGRPDISGIPARTLLPLGIHYTVREAFAVVKLLVQGI